MYAVFIYFGQSSGQYHQNILLLLLCKNSSISKHCFYDYNLMLGKFFEVFLPRQRWFLQSVNAMMSRTLFRS